jgi:hypothetical protein
MAKLGTASRGRRPLARVAELLESFPGSSGFHPYTLSVYAWPTGSGRYETPENSLERSLRLELDGCRSHVRLFAGRHSGWRRETAQLLERAGYERWLADDHSVDLRRWLRGRQEMLRELTFLRALGRAGTLVRWPERHASRQAGAVKHGRWARRTWQRVLHDVEEAGIEWDDAAVGISRVVDLAGLVEARELRIMVGALAFDRTRFLVFASASLNGGDMAWDRIPPTLAGKLRHVVSAAGFKPDGARLRPRVGFDREVRSAAAAANVCARTFEAIMAATASSVRAKPGSTDRRHRHSRSQGNKTSPRASARAASRR